MENKTKKKLTLNKETIKDLTENQLQAVAGGATDTIINGNNNISDIQRCHSFYIVECLTDDSYVFCAPPPTQAYTCPGRPTCPCIISY